MGNQRKVITIFYNLIKDNSSGLGSKLKDFAFGFTVKAAEKAKEVKILF